MGQFYKLEIVGILKIWKWTNFQNFTKFIKFREFVFWKISQFRKIAIFTRLKKLKNSGFFLIE